MAKQFYGNMPDGTPVEEITIANGGLSATIITYGANLTKLVYAGKDVVLGFNNLEEYLPTVGSIGITVGRYANRIADGKFTLNGVQYDVGCNENGVAHLHGGFKGFDKHVWTVTALTDNSVTFRLISPDGDMGYPGTMTADVCYTVEENDTLAISYRAVCDKDTVVNLTNHAYFNLNGYDGGDILDTELCIHADTFLPVDDHLIPTGERRAVAGTAFDFRTAKPIGCDIGADDEQLRIGKGYDINFCLGDAPDYRHAVSAYSPRSGIRMDCYTNEPGVQLYTGNMLECDFGKGGPLYKHQGFCLETQHYPDSPNQLSFPTTVLKAGDTYESITRYAFSKE